MKPVELWDEGDLQYLIDHKLGETLHREYKVKLSLEGDRERKELCKDVSALANGEGGIIVFGLDEADSEEGGSLPVRLAPLTDRGQKEVAERVLLDGVSPRIEFRFYPIEATDGSGEYLVLDVPKSLRGLHMVTLKKENRYYIRRNFSSVPMTPFEIEEAYRNLASREQDAESRLTQYKLHNPNSRLEQPDSAWMSLAMVPSHRTHGLFSTLCFKPRGLMLTATRGLHSSRGLEGSDAFSPNFFGLISTGRIEDRVIYSHQIYREGALSFGYSLNNLRREKRVFAVSLAVDLHDMFSLAAGLYLEAGYSGSVHYLAEVEGIRSFRLEYGFNSTHSSLECSLDRFWHSDSAEVGDIVSSPGKVLQGLQDHLWQTFGLQRCGFYVSGATGEYTEMFLSQSRLVAEE